MIYMIENKNDFDQKIAEAGEKLIVVDFYADWCGPCKAIAPILEELANQYANQALVLKVNVDHHDEITAEYNITSMPTFVFIRNGQIIDIFVGGNKLVKSMQKYVGVDFCNDHLQDPNTVELTALPVAPYSPEFSEHGEPQVTGNKLIEKVITEEHNIN